MRTFQVRPELYWQTQQRFTILLIAAQINTNAFFLHLCTFLGYILVLLVHHWQKHLILL